MGYRTVIILNNDHSHQWANDPLLGQKIRSAGVQEDGGKSVDYYGNVVECVHADQQTLMMIDSLTGVATARGLWSPNETIDQIKEKLLRDMADRLGFRIVRKSGAA